MAAALSVFGAGMDGDQHSTVFAVQDAVVNLLELVLQVSETTEFSGSDALVEEAQKTVLRFVAANRTWGYTRIQGALQNLGHEIGRGTIAKVLKEAGVDPAPARQKRTTWKEFLRTHWDVLAAADFFSVEVWTALGLIRYHVFL